MRRHDWSLEFELEPVAAFSRLQKDPARIQRGASVTVSRDALHSDELKLPAHGRISGDVSRHTSPRALDVEVEGLGTLGRRYRARQLVNVGQFIGTECHAIRIIVIRPVIYCTERNDGARTNHKRQAEEAV